jgi:thiamine kinase-like enzyme
LEWLPKDFLFTKEELIERLPKVLPQSVYHGDLTLENILYTGPGFHLIDPVTIEYDSFIFDIAKLRQDLVCRWFIRNNDVKLETKLQFIDNELQKYYTEACDNSLLILMLLRVLKHCETGDNNYQFLMKEIERLWK